ncbi:MAG: dTDP-4-dehydrorhamnose 3,5-epimerase [Candidatus Neomarinimicrobiota bacterium]|nr:dTDP-4-dehydrorhamnose 3,5-epimerase [Candidatus Neomarinimicrobiota bacterium]|tara:strand:- start:6978 stop:7502 length:525 start_codon:yes stop_codon:yes gene_type:complete
MIFKSTHIDEVKIIKPTIFEDNRGFFFESYHAQKFRDNGIDETFVQLNHSKSVKHTLRGLHYQKPQAQGKLVRCIYGEVLDVAVDIRKDSPSFRKWVSIKINSENKKQVYVPPGFAHGFLVLSDYAEIIYQCTELYNPKNDKGIIWNDSSINIEWGIKTPILSKKDSKLLPLNL